MQARLGDAYQVVFDPDADMWMLKAGESIPDLIIFTDGTVTIKVGVQEIAFHVTDVHVTMDGEKPVLAAGDYRWNAWGGLLG